MSAPRLALLLSFAFGASGLLAQDAGGPARPAAPLDRNPPLRSDTAPVGSLQPVSAPRMRDPFRGPARLEGTVATYGADVEGSPASPHRPVVELRLMGLLRVKDRAPAALLHCDQLSYCVVRAGDRFSAGKPVRVDVEVLEVSQGAVRLLIDGEEREIR